MMQPANLFELKSLLLKVTYSASSIDGKPQLSYKKGAEQKLFRGDELRHEQTEIGTLVSVTLAAAPDAYTSVFTLILPQVNVQEGNPQAEVRVKALQTNIKTSIAGPALVNGQVQCIDKVYALRGKARAVVF
jgi:hypothetical protein